MKLFRRLLLLLALAPAVSAQISGPATNVRFGPTDPATCQAGQGMVFWNTTSGVLKGCNSTNTWTAVGGGSGDALTTNPLSQFAATTSLQLLGVISNESGTGLLVFNDTPTLIAPLLGTPTSVTLTNATGLPPTTGIVGWPANASGVLTNDGAGALSWAAAGGGSQTPWTSLIDGDGFNLEDVGSLIPRAGSILGSATLPWLESWTGNTTQYEKVSQSAGLIRHDALGSATNIGIELAPKGTGSVKLALTNATAGTTAPVLFGNNGQLWSSSVNSIGIGSASSQPNAHLYLTNSGSTPFDFWLNTSTPHMNFINAGIAQTSTSGLLAITNLTAGQWASLQVGVRDAGTTTLGNGLIVGRQSSGTPAAGLGSAILFNINSSTTADQNAGQIATLWTTATHASRTADLTISLVNNAAALAEVFRIGASGALTIKVLTFATLPASPVAGMLVGISDSDASTFGATITAGGGANKGLAYYNGTAWTFR